MGFFDFFRKEQAKINPSNPLNIVDDPNWNQYHHLPNLVDSFANDLKQYYRILELKNENVTAGMFSELIIYYAIDLMIEYKNKSLNKLPKTIVDEVKGQVIEAAKQLSAYYQNPKNTDYLIYVIDQFTKISDIEKKTLNYMQKLKSTNSV